MKINRKLFVSMFCLLLVAIIPLCSINLHNYSSIFSSLTDTVDESETNAGSDDITTEDNEDEADITTEDDEVKVQATGDWAEHYTTPQTSMAGYTVKSASELAYFIDNTPANGANVVLTANIDLSAYNWSPINVDSGTFRLDGNGFIITGLTMSGKHIEDIANDPYHPSSAGGHKAGLFGRIQGNLQVYDLIVEGSISGSFYAKGVCNVGGIVAEQFGGRITLENCVSKVNIDLENTVFGLGGLMQHIGGIIGRALSDITISGCMNIGNISYTISNGDVCYVGGIVGYAHAGITLTDCANYGAITAQGAMHVAGICGALFADSTFIRCANFGSVTPTIGDSFEEVAGGGAYTGGIIGRSYYGANLDFINCGSYGFVNSQNSTIVGSYVGWLDGSTRWFQPNTFVTYSSCYAGSNAADKIEGKQESGVVFTGSVTTSSNETAFLSGTGQLDTDGIGETWTSVAAYNKSALGDSVLSHYVDEMEIKVKVRQENGSLSDYRGSAVTVTRNGSSVSGLDKNSGSLYYYRSLKYCNVATIPFYIYNSSTEEYSYAVYYTDNSAPDGLGEIVPLNTEQTMARWSLTGTGNADAGTYSAYFADITIVIEELIKIEPLPTPGFTVYYSNDFYDGGDLPYDLFMGYEGGTISATYSDGTLTADTTVTVTITPEENYEFLGLFVTEDFNASGALSDRRIERFNSLSYDDLLGDDIPEDVPDEDIEGLPTSSGTRVSASYGNLSQITYTFKISDLILSMDVEEIIEEEETSPKSVDDNDLSVGAKKVSNQITQVVIGGGAGGGNGSLITPPSTGDGEEGETGEEEEEETGPRYKISNIVYASSFEVVFVAYRHDYTLNVSYVGGGSDNFMLNRGFATRARFAERSSYSPSFYYDGETTSASTLTIGGSGNYFSSSNYVEYVAVATGDIEGYISTVGWSSISGIGFSAPRSYIYPLQMFRNFEPDTSSGEDVYVEVNITIKYFESPRHDYSYTLYLTDAYEDYETRSYMPGHLVGETYYYGSTQITKHSITVGSTSVNATYIPFTATFRENFYFNRYDPLNSYFDGTVDTSRVLGSTSTSVGGRSINIYSTLSGIATRTTKVPITGYQADSAFNLSTSYSGSGRTNLASTSLYNIMLRYGNLSRNGDTLTLFTFYDLRNPYTINIQTAIDGNAVTGLSVPGESVFTANQSSSNSSVSLTCEAFDHVSLSVTDKLVYRNVGGVVTFYSFDNITLGTTVLSESDQYNFQALPTNETSRITLSINFKEEFSINTNNLTDATPINYDASIWEVDSANDLLAIAYRVYCQGETLANRIVQTADIDFEGGYMIPIGTDNNPFSSVYDGGYYRIENMRIVGGNARDIGLFGYADGATIRNLTLMNAVVDGGYNVGTVAGYVNNTTFERVGSYNGTVSIMEEQGAGMGIFLTNGTAVAEASRQSGTYTYLNFGSSSTASYQLLSIMVAESVENTSDLPGFAGDFAGNLNNSSVSICYVRKSDTNSSAIGGFAGRIFGGSESYAYTSRPTFALSIESASLTHYHTSISDISTSCPDCDDRFIW